VATAPALVLLDVPCSNSGVLARRVEAALRWSEAQTNRLAELQRHLLTQGRGLLAPGGWLVYSTCSIDRAENQEQVAWAAAHLGLDVIAEEATLPAGVPGEGVYRDGSFWCVMRVQGRGRRDQRPDHATPRQTGSDAHLRQADGVHSAH
jgi:16S rRNA C967 or C1407 C5-methylase (RsmB/RsmF family)